MTGKAANRLAGIIADAMGIEVSSVSVLQARNPVSAGSGFYLSFRHNYSDVQIMDDSEWTEWLSGQPDVKTLVEFRKVTRKAMESLITRENRYSYRLNEIVNAEEERRKDVFLSPCEHGFLSHADDNEHNAKYHRKWEGDTECSSCQSARGTLRDKVKGIDCAECGTYIGYRKATDEGYDTPRLCSKCAEEGKTIPYGVLDAAEYGEQTIMNTENDRSYFYAYHADQKTREEERKKAAA